MFGVVVWGLKFGLGVGSLDLEFEFLGFGV